MHKNDHFGQFFAYFSTSRIKFENPLGDAITITINSMSLKFDVYLLRFVLFIRVAIDFCSSSPSIMGPSVKFSISTFYGTLGCPFGAMRDPGGVLGGPSKP